MKASLFAQMGYSERHKFPAIWPVPPNYHDPAVTMQSYEDGMAALKLLRAGYRPDVVVLDITMPKVDGIEVLAKILAIDKTIPIIINTAYSTYKDNFMTWSANEYIVKSGDMTELKEKIAKYATVPTTR